MKGFWRSEVESASKSSRAYFILSLTFVVEVLVGGCLRRDRDGILHTFSTTPNKARRQRGQRSKAKATDILPTPEDDKIVGKSFVALIAEMIVAFTPGNSGWKDRKDIVEAVAAMMPEDRPLPPDKSDPRPFGLLDTNEGSKKGVVKVLGGIQERSTLSQTIWASIWRIFVGDWLTSNNLRAARRDRTDDINAMERLEYAQELSAPFHFALQATHMIMRIHYGHAVEDPASLAAHKGLLNHEYDTTQSRSARDAAMVR
ncbi:hypothetical protein B0H10DRAFT_2217565 [Mycena sp. CBHHK59/15]|nr:hypothetical protein B0H10DRAFT_2217565 [Mycena sp. CBHHK59/15]